MPLTDHSRSPLPSLTGEALCELCARQGGTCCRTDPALSYQSFPLSSAEWRRLVPYAALAVPAAPEDPEHAEREEAAEAEAAALANIPLLPESATEAPPANGDVVCSVEPNHPDFIASMHALFPGKKKRIADLFPNGGTHFSLRIRSDGACVFLGREGCRLPRDVRPWYCRIFPAWIMDDALTLFLSSECLISAQAKGPIHGLQLLDRTLSHVHELHAALRRDWNLL